MLNFTYLSQPPKRYTFEQPKLKEWLESWCEGTVLNLFAGTTLLKVAKEVRVDIGEEAVADYYMDAFSFVTMWANEKRTLFDTIVLDPPYSLRKSREKYEGRSIGSFTKIKNVLPSILKPGGRIITFGYDSVGMSKSRGFTKLAICLVCHNGDHDDTVSVVEEKDEICLVEEKIL